MESLVRKLILLILSLLLPFPILASPFPISIANILVTRQSNDVQVSIPATITDLYGNLLTIEHYNVYRNTSPDFVPDTSGHSNLLGTTSDNSYTDADAMLSVESYYYLVTAVSEDGTESPVPSNLGYKIRMDLVYDASADNKFWFTLPGNTALVSSDDIAALSPNITHVIKWDGETQQEVIANYSDNPGGSFDLTPGDAYAVIINADTVLNMVGSYSEQSRTLTAYFGQFNHHWVGIQQPSAYPSLSALAAANPQLSKLAVKDGASYSSWVNLNGQWLGTDVPLSPGVAVLVSATSQFVFEPATGIPTTSANSTPDVGYETVTIDLQAVASDVNGSIVSYQWDFDGDGVFDATGATAQATYTQPGTYYPTVLVTDDQGQKTVAFATVVVESLNVNLSVSGFTPASGEDATINYTLPVDGSITLKVYGANDTLIRTLLTDSPQGTGPQSVLWDGRNEQGELVSDGSYYVTIEFNVAGHLSTYDTRATGGVDITGDLTEVNISQNLSPLEGEYVNIDYTLPENALVTITIYGAGHLIRQLLSDATRQSGPHSELWDGADENGRIVAPGTSFSIAIRATSLAENSLLVNGQVPSLDAVSVSPYRFSPATNPYGLQTDGSVVVDFSLNTTTDVVLNVYSSTNVLLRSITGAAMPSGTNQLSWNGRNDAGVLMTDGLYTLRLQATDAQGQQSTIFNIQTQIYY